MSSAPAKAGLEDVVAGTSRICFVDGIEGRLIYQGYDIHDLVAHATFEETVYLLWHGKLPTAAQYKEFRDRLAEVRALPAPVIDLIKSAPSTATPMEILRTATSFLSFFDPAPGDESTHANFQRAGRLQSQMASIVATIGRVRMGGEPLQPDPKRSLAGDFLRMLFGSDPDELSEKTMDVALILHADHEFNASTFTARVAAATMTDMYSAVVAAIGALKGPLHGGANEQVMRMLMEIGSPDKAEAWVDNALANKVKIPGFGHRVYKTEDPRARHLREMSRRLGERAGDLRWLETSENVRHAVEARRNIYPNVDFYSASTYYSMGIPLDLFTPIFAVSRVSGWTAHILEQQANNRIIRPRAEYTGPARLDWVPMDKRG